MNTTMHRLSPVISLTTLFFTAANLHADTACYFGPSSGSTGWTTVANWYADADKTTPLGGYPGADDDVIIMGDVSRTAEVNSSINAKSVTFGTHGTGYHSLLIGNGTLTVGGGTGTISNSAGNNSYLVISGAATLRAGTIAAGCLEMRSGGSITIGEGQNYSVTTVTMGRSGNGSETSKSTITLDGGTLNAYQIKHYDTSSKASGLINWNAGTLRFNHATYTDASINGITISGVDYTTTIALGGGGSAGTRTLTTSRKTTIGPLAVFADQAGVRGSLKKDGTADLIFQSAQTFTGEFEIAAGKVTLAAGGSLAAGVINLSAATASLDINAQASGWTLAATQTLAGTGTVNGKTNNINVTVRGALAAGSNVKFDLGTGIVDLSSATFAFDSAKGAATFSLGTGTTVSFGASPTLSFGQLAFSKLDTLTVGGNAVTIFSSPVAINAFNLDSVTGTHTWTEDNILYELSIALGADNKSLQMQVLSATPATIPEPATTALLLGLSLCFAALACRRSHP